MRERGRAVVVGAGVSGLTTALCLRAERFSVTIVADRFAPQVTSVVAGALWEWPPAVCGYHHDQISLERSKAWCMTSYRRFIDLAGDPATGVHFRPAVFYFTSRVEERSSDLRKMNELRDQVQGFRHDASLIQENGVSPAYGVVDAYMHMAPMVDTDQYMDWLRQSAVRAGCEIRQQFVPGSLRDHEAAIRSAFGADIIANCSGLGAMQLTPEPMYPLRGALVRVKNDGRRFPRITAAHCVSHDESSGGQDIVFIVPRGEDMLVLGGLAEADEWSTDIGLHNHQPVRDMYERCLRFLPQLAQGEIDPAEPVRAGLRPFRRANVRVDHEAGTSIIHNYAHGGAGVTFSWGCAREVAETAAMLWDASVRDRSNAQISMPFPAASAAANT